MEYVKQAPGAMYFLVSIIAMNANSLTAPVYEISNTKRCSELGMLPITDYYECSDAAKSLKLAVTNADRPNRVYEHYQRPSYCYLEEGGKQLSFNRYTSSRVTTWVGRICANKAQHRETCSDGTLGYNGRMTAQVEYVKHSQYFCPMIYIYIYIY